MLIKIETKKRTGPLENVIDTINIREPLASDMLGLDFLGKNLQESTQVLASRLTTLTKKEIEDLPLKEWIKIQNAINKLMT